MNYDGAKPRLTLIINTVRLINNIEYSVGLVN